MDFRSKEKAIKKRDPRLVHVRYNSLEKMNVLEVEWGLQPIIEHINLSAPSHAAASPAAAGPLDPNSSVLELGEEVTKLNAARTPERDTLPALLEGLTLSPAPASPVFAPAAPPLRGRTLCAQCGNYAKSITCADCKGPFCSRDCQIVHACDAK